MAYSTSYYMAEASTVLLARYITAILHYLQIITTTTTIIAAAILVIMVYMHNFIFYFFYINLTKLQVMCI